MQNILKFFLLSVLSLNYAYGQTDSLSLLYGDFSENESVYNELILELRENPININSADKNDLMRIPLVTEQMADSILKIRLIKKRFTNRRQIRPATGTDIYDLIKDLITIKEYKNYRVRITQRNTYKLETIPEIESGKYSGNALYNYSRIIYHYKSKWKIGIITQKDPGEQSYADHLNYAAEYSQDKWQVILGNYYLHFGMGLTHSNPYGMQKSIYIPAIFRESYTVARSNLTSSESSGKFGLFSGYTMNESFSVFAFYSDILRDVTLSDGYVTNLRFDGYHRSDYEQESAKKLKEKNFGAGLSYNFSGFKISGLYSTYKFSPGFENNIYTIGDSKKRRQYFAFNGDGISLVAFSYRGGIGDLNLSGEYSSNLNGSAGTSHAVYYSKEKINIGFRYWLLDKNFQSPEGRAFDNSDAFPRGVRGYFAGIQFNLFEAFTVSAFKQYEKNLWRTYFEPLPSQQSDWVTQIDWNAGKVSSYLRFRSRTTEELAGSQLPRVNSVQKSIRAQVNYSPSKPVRLRTRLEHTFFEGNDERGLLFFQDLIYYFGDGFSLNTRWSFFKTTSYDSRLYEYESDLPGSFSNTALSGNGNKFYLLFNWKMNNSIQIWTKWRYVVKLNQQETGDLKKELNRDLRLQMAVSL